VRYSAEAEPVFVGVCHCKNCQKGTGTAFRVAVAIPTAALTVKGTLKTFNDHGDSGKILFRRFCPECGSSIFNEGEVMPGIAILGAGTLDDASWVRPTMEIYCNSAQNWVQLAGQRERFPKSLPGPG